MKLTEEKKRKFVDWLSTKTNIKFYQCGICGSKDFGILDEVLFLNTSKLVEYPLVGIICIQCRNIQTFSAVDSGVMDDD